MDIYYITNKSNLRYQISCHITKLNIYKAYIINIISFKNINNSINNNI